MADHDVAMATDRDPRQAADYHLDLEVDGAKLLLRVEGPAGPVLRRHVAEVRRAAERCGLHLVVRGWTDEPGMLA